MNRSLRLTRNLINYAQLAINGKLVQLPMAVITDEFGFSLAPEGWNSYCALLEDFERNPQGKPEDSLFWRFFCYEKIRSIQMLNDLLFLHDPAQQTYLQDCPFYLGTYPWGGLTPTDSLGGGIPFGWYYDQVESQNTRDLWGYGRNLWYEPGDRYTLEVEWQLTLRLYTILKQGYHPWRHASFPSVTRLVREDGTQRALILDGHHRLAVLKVLGYEYVTVVLADVVHEKDVQAWHYVRNGHCSTQQALAIFHAFFEINGRERLVYLDLLS